MKIGLIGAGRLGICLALLIERAGYEVLVSDIRPDYVDALNKKKIVTEEPDVQCLLKQTERFEATWDNQRVIDECDFIICLVATPSLNDGSYDISSVWNVVEDFKKSEAKLNGKTLVIGCTTNPGDCEKFSEELAYFGVGVVYNPEFIAQGTIVRDLQNADMVLIGGADDDTYAFMQNLYGKIQARPPRWGRMSTTAAELVKIAVNCFVTTKISYANMVGQVMIGAGLDEEIDTVLQASEMTLESEINILSSGMDLVVHVFQETIVPLHHLHLRLVSSIILVRLLITSMTNMRSSFVITI